MNQPNLGPFPPPPAGKSGWPWTGEPAPLPPARPDGSPWPRVSIVTPSFNQGQFIEETIRSVLLQGYPDLEYRILDAGSKDGTLDVIRKYEKHLTGWVSEPDKGQSDAINKGFARCTGELMNWLNSDDVLAPGALRAIALAAASDPDAGVYVGTAERVNAAGQRLHTLRRTTEQVNNPLDWYENHFSQAGAYFRRRVWTEAGPLDLSLHYAMDVDFWIRAAKLCRFATVPECIAIDRDHAAAKTTAQRPEMYGELAGVQVRHGGLDVVRRDVTNTRKDLQEAHAALLAMMNSPVYRMMRWIIPQSLWTGLKRRMGIP